MDATLETKLIEAGDSDFQAMLDGAKRLPGGIALPPEGLESPGVISGIRAIARRLRDLGSNSTWMMVSGDTAVGLIGHKGLPVEGIVEIGYSVARKHRALGHATRAVAAVLCTARNDPALRIVEATTTYLNVASHRVLEKNGFTRSGTRFDPADDKLILWRKRVSG